MNGYRNVLNLLPLALPIVLAVLFISIIYLDRVQAQEVTPVPDGVNLQPSPVFDISKIDIMTVDTSTLTVDQTNLVKAKVEASKEDIILNDYIQKYRNCSISYSNLLESSK